MDVFLSYASEDRDRARQIAQALEEAGWSVWWDRKIVTGETFDQTIEHELDSAKSVVVLWSHASIASEWVKNEATAASERQVLVPALVDDVKIPLEFRRRQTANLIDWDGDTSHEGFQALREGVAARVGTAAVARAPRAPASRANQTARWRRWGIVAGAVAAVALAIGAYRVWTNTADDGRDSSDATISTRDTTEQQPGADVGASQAGPNVAQSRVVPSSGGNSVNNPAPLALGAMHKVTLAKNEEYCFQLPAAVGAIRIVEDVRLQQKERRNLQTRLSILDADGGVAEADVIPFNEIDVGYRKTASFSTKQPFRIGFKLVNLSQTADIWLAASPEGKKQFLPFFGDIVPRPWSAGKDATGTLEEIEDVYYLVRLPRGENGVILDFANAKRENRNLQGYLAVLDADGGGQHEIIRLNEIDVSYRVVGSLSVKGDDPLILRLQNMNNSVNYSLRIPNAR